MNITVPEDYITGFIRANNTFLYQLVFDPVRRKLVPLNDYGDGVDPAALSYAGRYPFRAPWWELLVPPGVHGGIFSETFSEKLADCILLSFL